MNTFSFQNLISSFFFFFQSLDNDGPAWEKNNNFWIGLWHTTWQVMLHPIRTFTPSCDKFNLKWPLSYGLILGTFAVSSQTFWNYYIGVLDDSLFFTLAILLFTPLEVSIFLYFFAAIIHAMLLILGSAKRGYVATFRVLAYTQAAGLWILLPILGIPLAIFWGIIIFSSALAAIHGISKKRAFFALILPFFLILLFFALLGLLILGIGVLVIFF